MNTKTSRMGNADPTPPTPHSPHAEVLLDVEALVRGWQTLVVNRARPYALQQEDGTYRWVFHPLDTRALRAHFAGIHTVALSSLDERGCCRWACLDADAPDGVPRVHPRGLRSLEVFMVRLPFWTRGAARAPGAPRVASPAPSRPTPQPSTRVPCDASV